MPKVTWPVGIRSHNLNRLANQVIIEMFYKSQAQYSLVAFLLILVLVGSDSALAQAAATTATTTTSAMADLEAIRTGATVADDLASKIMTSLLGPTFTNPFGAAGGATTLFGVIFLAFNVIVFSAGVIWATYGVLSGVVQSAHEGEVLGKRMSAIWMPIRMVTGIGSLVPAFGGFSLSQVVMIVATGWGITFGNYAYLKALEKANQFTPLVNMNISAKGDNQSMEDLAVAIFQQKLCLLDYEAWRQAELAAGQSPAGGNVVSAQVFATAAEIPASVNSIGKAYGTPSDSTSCLAVGIKKRNYTRGTGTSTGGTGTSTGGTDAPSLGFQVASVNYDLISRGAFDRYKDNFNDVYSVIEMEAANWAEKVELSSSRSDVSMPPVPMDRIRAVGIMFSGFGAGYDSGNQGGALKTAAIENMKKYGFFGAGAFYSTFAELNTSIAQASNAVEVVIAGKKGDTLIEESSSSGLNTRYQRAFLNSIKQDKSAEARDVSCSLGGIETSTGNCSLGQKIVGLMIGGMTAGSGDGGSGTGSGRIIDPIIAAKNVGDYFMWTGETMMLASALMGSSKPDEDKNLLEKGASTVFSTMGKFNLLGGLAAAFGTMLPIIGGILFTVGALLSLNIPMVPFIHWVTALVQYMSIVVKSLAAAPLWSFAHLQPDGEGMGQRSERGYLYLLMLLFKPILMVIGFFAACGLVILLGSAVMWLFIPAMANAQGNSVTGLASVIGYVFMFFMLMNIIIQGLFNLVSDLSDDVIGWIGNVGRSQLGRDTEGKASNVFMAGGRFGTQAAGAAAQGVAGARAGGAGAAGAGAVRGAGSGAGGRGAGAGSTGRGASR